MTVAVATGTAVVGGTDVAISPGNVTIGAAHATNKRFDLVTVNASGTKAVTAGTAAASPLPPAAPAGTVVLAKVFVPAAVTAITSSHIQDMRVLLRDPAGSAGTSIWTTIVKSADESVTSSATLQPDNHLTFSASANSVYLIEVAAVYLSTVSNTGNFQAAFGLPTSATVRGKVACYAQNTDTYGETSGDLTNAALGPARAMIERRIFRMYDAHILVLSSAGVVAFQWAQLTSSANPTTVKQGSLLRYRRLI
jgi:hypothetical protein